MNTLQRYGFFGSVRLALDYFFTRLFYRNARLIRLPIYIRGRSAITLGDGLTTGVSVRLDAFRIRGNQIILSIGRNVHINDSVHIGAIEKVVIGDNVLIASRVFISDHNHGNYQIKDHSSNPGIPPTKRPLSSKPVFIGNNVWLGEQVCVLSGVSIGDGAVIGANSVVTHDIPSNTIAAGNPARVIRIFDTRKKLWRHV